MYSSKVQFVFFWDNFYKRINDILRKSKSIVGKIDITYSGIVDNKILDTLGKIKATTFQVLIAYGILFTLETLAKLAGFNLSGHLWSENRLTLATIFTSKLSPILKVADKYTKNEIHATRDRIEGKAEKKLFQVNWKRK